MMMFAYGVHEELLVGVNRLMMMMSLKCCNKRLSLVLSWIISPPYKENRLNSTRNYIVGLSVFHHAINTLFSICLQTDNGIYMYT
jgi:hypothetical protein